VGRTRVRHAEEAGKAVSKHAPETALSTQSTLLKVMSDAARKAAKGLVRDFGELEHLQVSKKGLADFVSAADLKAEKYLKEELTRVRPGYGFLGEEGGLVEGTDKSHTWIVDPLDGTTNFLHAIPHFAINIGLQRDGAIVAGVTFNPISNELFWAEKGKGSFLNDRRIRVSQRKTLDEALIGTGNPFLGRPGHGQFLKEVHQVGQRVAGLRRMGAASLDLAWVAAGKYDGFWERDLKPWDIAPGLLLVSEAGGTWSDIDGGQGALDSGNVVAGNADLQTVLLGHLKSVA
jgi:myo-inositol-1(or 4)-monophosphatase